MQIQYRIHNEKKEVVILFCFSISHYSFAKYDTFCDEIVFDTQIKSQFSPDELIKIGNYCNMLYEMAEQNNLELNAIN